ncbi:MAG: hypothetical protein SP4CHLAM5_00220 [Chlamydiia bacterium]|nr:hypothetical protein [Chlamydiia bacterium]MCH9617901.1 hypothetical protein [Chlamydiia bacterium]MCH9624117.1 hypothetical protein [Chlamydiia bacterium]
MKRYNFYPLILILYLPLWHIGKTLHGSIPYFLSVIEYRGVYNIAREIFSFSPYSIFVGALFLLYIKYAAAKISLFISSIFLLTLSYLFLSPSFFYDNLGLFFIITALSFDKEKQSEHLFFSLFFIALLHCFSSLLISIHYYGYNLPLLFAFLSPISAFYLLIVKKIYPSKITMLSLFPILLFPVSYYTHNLAPLTQGTLLSTLISTAAVYILLEKKSLAPSLSIFILSCLSLFAVEKMLLFPFIFTALALLINIAQSGVKMLNRKKKARREIGRYHL